MEEIFYTPLGEPMEVPPEGLWGVQPAARVSNDADETDSDESDVASIYEDANESFPAPPPIPAPRFRVPFPFPRPAPRQSPTAMPRRLVPWYVSQEQLYEPDLGNYNRKQWVRLNIGGTYFLSTKTTLCKFDNSFFGRLLNDESMLRSDTDNSGSIMIDRDARYFSCVLNYLRHGKVILEKNLSEEGLLEEAEFYNLSHLVDLVTEAIEKRDEVPPTVPKRTVYRVLQYNESEVSRMISELSDGWRFEQLINIGQEQQSGMYGYNEYLCVVSCVCDAVPENPLMTDRIRRLTGEGMRRPMSNPL